MKTFVYLSGLILLMPVDKNLDGKCETLVALLAHVYEPAHCPKVMAGETQWQASGMLTATSTAKKPADKTGLVCNSATLAGFAHAVDIFAATGATPETVRNACLKGDHAKCPEVAAVVEFKGDWIVHGAEVNLQHVPVAVHDDSLYGFGDFSVAPVDLQTDLGVREYYGGAVLESPADATVTVVDSTGAKYPPREYKAQECQGAVGVNAKCLMLGILNRELSNKMREYEKGFCPGTPTSTDKDVDVHYHHLYHLLKFNGQPKSFVPYIGKEGKALKVIHGVRGGGGDPRPKCSLLIM
jgi:hypothetical protein